MASGLTIFALATAPARAGVAIVRISGPESLTALTLLTGITEPVPGQARYTTLRHPQTGGVIDRGLALYFKGPHSFTGEDIIEFQLHGSMAVVRELLEVLSALPGLGHAEAGEFSRRAFLNGKMDLTQAEGLADLIAANTTQQKAQAMRQLEGTLSHYYEELRGRVLLALAHLEAYIDFPDEEIPEDVLTGLGREIAELILLIGDALEDDRRGESLREGIRIVILGAPNAGKSSLLNKLAGREAAIVSTQAGTTRDIIEVQLDLAGFPVILTDTAGIRQSEDEIEEEGIRRALRRAETADLKLVLFDGGQLPEADAASLELLDDRSLPLVSKSDALNARLPESLAGAMLVSAKTGHGVEDLLDVIEEYAVQYFGGENAPVITRDRHRALLTQAMQHLENVAERAELELACEELRQAALSIGKITGKIEVDDVLEVIFRQFCIGK